MDHFRPGRAEPGSVRECLPHLGGQEAWVPPQHWWRGQVHSQCGAEGKGAALCFAVRILGSPCLHPRVPPTLGVRPVHEGKCHLHNTIP